MERNVVAKIKKFMISQGAYVINLHGSVLMKGEPDLIACLKGRTICIEVKDVGKTKNLTTLQKLKLERYWAKAGAITMCADNVETVKQALIDNDLFTPS